MLGTFLEFSIPTADIRASLNFYMQLGFSEAAVGEAWQHPYAVVTDGRICLGLHEAAMAAPALTFVKPELRKYVEQIEQRGIELDYRHLGDEVFNEVGWSDRDGHWVRLIEARSFSPSKRRPAATSRCGYFVEIGLPAPDFDAAKKYWEDFGFVGLDESQDALPHISCTSDHIDIGLYRPADLPRSTLRFQVDDLAQALAELSQVGIAPRPAEKNRASSTTALLFAPEGTPILLAS